MDAAWTFPDPPDVAVITLSKVLEGGSPLRLVTHDEEDGCWQFLDGGHLFEEEATVVSLAEIVGFDPSLVSLADLPTGWYAWRSDPEQPWQRAPGEPPPDLLPEPPGDDPASGT